MAASGRRGFGFGRSVGVRFAAAYALVFGLSTAGLAMFLWWDTVGLLQRQVESAINVDARSLAARFRAGGLPLLIATINRRIALNVDDSAIYLVVDPAYQPIAGNLRGWPKVVSRLGVWYQVPVKRAQIVSLAEMRGYQLPLGFRLLIGRDVEARARLRALVAGGLLWAVLVMAVLGIAGALAIRSLLQRALANVSRTANAIAGGDLSHRVALSGRGDEFDLLAETINDMLDRMGRLMDGVRQVSNAIAH
ncbi:MAG: HAMP domain-containing protein, partial [Acetobacteraceae bacterium]